MNVQSTTGMFEIW